MEAVAAAIARAVSIPSSGSGTGVDTVRLQAVNRIKVRLKDSSFPNLVISFS
jgi:hypothetical protein